MNSASGISLIVGLVVFGLIFVGILVYFVYCRHFDKEDGISTVRAIELWMKSKGGDINVKSKGVDHDVTNFYDEPNEDFSMINPRKTLDFRQSSRQL